ncbi:MAG TPA: YchJ family protein [Chromatiaceae bacterium]|nr:YchJ family protein [Chromatiaceae bacterium]
MSNCPCGSGLEYAACCEPILSGTELAKTAEALMRARYSAYQKDMIAFLGESLHLSSRHDWDEAATRKWAEQSEWLGLEVRSTNRGGEDDEEGSVEFIATYKEDGLLKQHHEHSLFRKEGGRWYYVDGKLPTPETVKREAPKVGRNDPCPCGSGKKYKKCCGA